MGDTWQARSLKIILAWCDPMGSITAFGLVRGSLHGICAGGSRSGGLTAGWGYSILGSQATLSFNGGRHVMVEIDDSINPLKRHRVKLGLTQVQLATLSGVTPQVVTNVESGLYHKAPISITRYLSAKLGLTHSSLEKSYDNWVYFERGRNSSLFTHQFINTSGSWYDFRYSVKVTFRGFCRYLVFQPSLLQEFEKYNRNRNLVVQALSECLNGDTGLAIKLALLPKRQLRESGSIKEYVLGMEDKA